MVEVINSILIAGYGYVGRAVADYFRRKNQKVWCLCRSAEKSQAMEEKGITPVICDLARGDKAIEMPPAHFVLIALSADERTPEAYRRTYLKAVGNLLMGLKRHRHPWRIVYLSSTAVYGNRHGEWVDESTVPRPESESEKILLEAEHEVLQSGMPVIVYRLGGIYGPGRNRLHARKLNPSLNKTYRHARGDNTLHRYLNMIHIDDIVGSLPILFDKARQGEIYLGVDNEPVLETEFVSWLAKALPATAAESLQLTDLSVSRVGVSGKRCRNTKLKELGYCFRYPTFREGYGALLKEEFRDVPFRNPGMGKGEKP